MNRIKSFFKDRHFSVDGLVDVVVSAAGLAAFAFAIMGLIYVGSKYPVECFATLMGIIILAGIGYILFGIFDEVFPKRDPELEQWLNDAKEELKEHHDSKKVSSDGIMWKKTEIIHESN